MPRHRTMRVALTGMRGARAVLDKDFLFFPWTPLFRFRADGKAWRARETRNLPRGLKDGGRRVLGRGGGQPGYGESLITEPARSREPSRGPSSRDKAGDLHGPHPGGGGAHGGRPRGAGGDGRRGDERRATIGTTGHGPRTPGRRRGEERWRRGRR